MEATAIQSKRTTTDGLSTGVAWFSVGLGLAELLAPRRVARLIGASDKKDRTTKVLRAMGARELINGVGILTRRAPHRWMQARVAGDVADLGFLTALLRRSNGSRGRTVAATAAVLGVTGLDVFVARRLGRSYPSSGPIHVEEAVTIYRPPNDVYEFWRNLENLPRFMRHLQSVRSSGDGRSHWTVRAPVGQSVEWDAVITEDRPGEVIAWRSLGGDVKQMGSVRFRPAPGERGTEVHVRLRYEPPAGQIGALFAKLFREEPSQQIRDDLRALKQVLETGEVLVSDATVHRGLQPAHPTREGRGQ